MYGMPEAATANVLPMRPRRVGSGSGAWDAREVRDIDEVRPSRAYPSRS